MSSKGNKVRENLNKEKVKKTLVDPRHKNLIYTGIFLGIVLTFFVINNTNGEPERGPYPPDYKVASGETLQLSDLRGKIVILDFWATWCGPCRKGIPDLVELKNEYKDKGVEIVGISIDEFTRDTKGEVIPFIKEYKINYPIVYGTINITQLYGGIRSVPTSFVIDKEGKVISQYVGLVPKSNYVRDIKKILGASYDNSESVDAPDFKLPLAEVN